MSQRVANTSTIMNVRALRADMIRRRIVTIVMIVYWLLIFEGALRKWMFPQIQQILFFIRDPFVLCAYWMMLQHRLSPKSNILNGFLGLAVLSICLAPFYLMFAGLNPLVSIYGWRTYYLYAPLAFLIDRCFLRSDLLKWLKHNLYICIPLSLLSFIQFKSPSNSYINKGLGDVGEGVFVVAGDIVRTYGTFTFTAGQTMYVVSVWAMVMAIWLMPNGTRPVSTKVLSVATLASISMVLLSGSRTALILSGLNIAIGLWSASLHKRLNLKTLWLVAIIVSVVGGLFMTVFEDSFNAIKARQEATGTIKESIIDRIIFGFTGFVDVIPDAPLFGYGLGLGTMGGSSIATGIPQFMLAEGEWERIILEVGPILALLYIGLRCFLALHITRCAIRSARMEESPLALLLLAFILPSLVSGQMTMQGTINGYGWLFCGFAMAASRSYRNDVRSTP
jgi:hypothetical protein